MKSLPGRPPKNRPNNAFLWQPSFVVVLLLRSGAHTLFLWRNTWRIRSCGMLTFVCGIMRRANCHRMEKAGQINMHENAADCARTQKVPNTSHDPHLLPRGKKRQGIPRALMRLDSQSPLSPPLRHPKHCLLDFPQPALCSHVSCLGQDLAKLGKLFPLTSPGLCSTPHFFSPALRSLPPLLLSRPLRLTFHRPQLSVA